MKLYLSEKDLQAARQYLETHELADPFNYLLSRLKAVSVLNEFNRQLQNPTNDAEILEITLQ